jgi:UDP-N-acetylglucosamine:LPS N-acetylglucosamine transferase
MTLVENSSVAEIKNQTAKKKILVLISEGGGGHKAAGDSLREILGKSYSVDVVNALSKMLRPIDGLSLITFGKFTAEDLYNLALRRGYHRFIKVLFCHIGTFYMRGKKKHIEALFDKYLQKSGEDSPSLIISTFPMINAPLLAAAQEHDIPLLIMPTDLDSETFLMGMDEVQIKDQAKLVVAMPYDDPDLQLKAIREGRLKAKHLSVTGFPVRPACFKRYNDEEIAQLKRKHGIYEKMPTLTLIMGAVGGDAILEYTQEISKLKIPHCEKSGFQLNVCVGRNKKIGQKIKEWILQEGGEVVAIKEGFFTLKSREGNFLHVRDFTKEVVEIMSCSDLIITKTGSCSVNEAIYLGKKLLLDNTDDSSARHIWWESFNVSFVKKHNLGDAFCQVGELQTKILTLLNQTFQPPSARGDFKLPSFEQNILSLIKSLIG